MAIVDRMSNSEKMREVTWKPARVAKMSHKVGLKCPGVGKKPSKDDGNDLVLNPTRPAVGRIVSWGPRVGQ